MRCLDYLGIKVIHFSQLGGVGVRRPNEWCAALRKITSAFKVLLWSKNQFPFFLRFWKCDCLTLDWQNFELWFLFKGCLSLRVSLDFTVRRPNLPTGPQRVWSREKWRHSLTSLKFQSVNAAYYICKIRVQKSESPKLPCCVLIQPRTNALYS